MDRLAKASPVSEENDVPSAPQPRDWGDDWVHELIEMTRPGVEINLANRGLRDRVIPFQFDDFS